MPTGPAGPRGRTRSPKLLPRGTATRAGVAASKDELNHGLMGGPGGFRQSKEGQEDISDVARPFADLVSLPSLPSLDAPSVKGEEVEPQPWLILRGRP